MTSAGPGERPPSDMDINRDLGDKLPEPKVSIEAVRRGFTALRRSNVRLLNHDGSDMSEAIGDALSYPTTNGLLRLINLPTSEAEMVAHIIADAALVDELPKDTNIYAEKLFVDAITFIDPNNTAYGSLPDDERLKLAGFMWRPARLRTLPYSEMMLMLYPEGLKPNRGSRVDYAAQVDDTGLSRMTALLIESKFDAVGEEEADRVWAERDWGKYSHFQEPSDAAKTPGGRHEPPQGAAGGEEPGVLVPKYNLPDAIGTIIVDVINYLSAGLPGDRTELNLDRIMEATKKVLPHRKRLYELEYFEPHTQEPERHALLDRIFRDQPLESI